MLITFLKVWCTPPLRIQVSYRCTLLVICGIDIIVIIIIVFVVVVVVDHIINFYVPSFFICYCLFPFL